MACMIGLTGSAAIPLLTYDAFVNVCLSGCFAYPLFRSNMSTARMKKVARRNLIASAVSLTTSTMNIAVLAFLKAHELGWVCLGLCGLDVIVNATALFWLTSKSTRETRTASIYGEPTQSRQYYLNTSAPPSPWKPAFGEIGGPPGQPADQESEMTLSPPSSPKKTTFADSEKPGSSVQKPAVLVLKSRKSRELKRRRMIWTLQVSRRIRLKTRRWCKRKRHRTWGFICRNLVPAMYNSIHNSISSLVTERWSDAPDIPGSRTTRTVSKCDATSFVAPFIPCRFWMSP
ncbi:hypothetical protein C8J56DRAFT_175363 [Mycena floridula]|nr:hypothetical protein C8J56DRAFT_175363 [Mycena floridula]